MHEVQRLELPEFNKEFFTRIGVESEEDLAEQIRGMLERQTTYEQRQATRRQVLGKITESANWELPEHLVLKQVENALHREMLEMQQAGFTRQEIQRRGLPMALTPEGTTTGVAEHTILLMLAAAKRLTFADRELRAGRWHVNSLRAVSRELYGKAIGYVGMGRIGHAVAERLKAFGCPGLYADPAVRLSAAREE